MNSFVKIFKLLNFDERIEAYKLLFLIFTMSIFDILGVASIFPFIQILINPILIETNIVLSNLYAFSSDLGFVSIRQFQYLVGILVFFLLIFSLFVRAFTFYKQVQFSFMKEYTIGKRLSEAYLNQPYGWFLNKNTSNLGKNILSEVNTVVINGIMPMTNFVAQSILVLTLIILILIVSPNFSMTIGLVLFLSYGVVFFFNKTNLQKTGSKALIVNTNRFKVLSEAFNSIKDIKINGSEKFYLKLFDEPSRIFASNQASNQLISNIPRYFIEGLLFGGMILFLIILIKGSGSFIDVVPVIALYAFVGYRLIPALQQIYYSISQITYAKAAISELFKDLEDLKIREDAKHISLKVDTSNLIELDQVSFSYKNSKKLNLSNVNLNIKKNSKVAIVGPTGSGKSTLLDLMLGLISPTQGSIKIFDQTLQNKNFKSWLKIVGYVPQQINLIDDTVAANVAFGLDKKDVDIDRVVNCCKIVDMHEFIMHNMQDGYNTFIGEKGLRLSGGQKQRVGICRALYFDPEILILDEPTSALNVEDSKKIMKDILSLNKTIIVISHDQNIIPFFKNIINFCNKLCV
jgi:ABC-type multidrug transport system fused ATPase/permease subunit